MAKKVSESIRDFVVYINTYSRMQFMALKAQIECSQIGGKYLRCPLWKPVQKNNPMIGWWLRVREHQPCLPRASQVPEQDVLSSLQASMVLCSLRSILPFFFPSPSCPESLSSRVAPDFAGIIYQAGPSNGHILPAADS